MYIITASNINKTIQIENAQNKQDAIIKAEFRYNIKLINPKVSFKLTKHSNHYNPKSFRYPETGRK